jgi:GT2 family glycosyltransferase
MNKSIEGTGGSASDHNAGVAPRRVLLAMLVYNGETFVPRAIESMARLQGMPGETGANGKLRSHIVDALVLDDASPAPGWSAALAEQCKQLNVGYYRTPRNLGIPRNMNLGLLRGEAAGYDYVAILNSDVIFPANMVEGLVAAAQSRPGIGSVTAWTNNASIFSLPNDDPDRWLADLSTVDSISATLTAEFGAETVEIPVGVGFCLLISARAISEVGLFDPVFGRGYCEEVDWCCRAVAAGFTHVLAPSVFVYHIGSATNRVAGLLQPGEHTVHTNETIIDQRHPDYRARVAAWEATPAPVFFPVTGPATILPLEPSAASPGEVFGASADTALADSASAPSESTSFNSASNDSVPAQSQPPESALAESTLARSRPTDWAPTGSTPARSAQAKSGTGMTPTVSRGLRALVQRAALEHGYLIDATWLRRTALDPTDRRVRISINPDGPNPLVEAIADGWRCEIPVGPEGILAGISAFIGCAPSEIRLLDQGNIASALSVDAALSGIPVQALRRYPERV